MAIRHQPGACAQTTSQPASQHARVNSYGSAPCAFYQAIRVNEASYAPSLPPRDDGIVHYCKLQLYLARVFPIIARLSGRYLDSRLRGHVLPAFQRCKQCFSDLEAGKVDIGAELSTAAS